MKGNNREINIENIKTDDDFVKGMLEVNFFEIETQNITKNTDTNLVDISQNEIKLQGSTEEQNTKEKNQGKLILI